MEGARLDRALGALLGAAVGDAAGAVLEFEDGLTAADVERALAMPGGGCWAVGPGQFTDDAELALCQAHGLAGQPPSAGFPANSVAREYCWWCNRSFPFDIGTTTTRAFRLRDFEATADYAAAVAANVQSPASLSSQANGATMRSTPLAIWAHRLEPQAIAAAAAADAALSHPSQVCRDANAVYVLAVAALIRQPGDAAAALAAAEGWAAAHACADVRAWLAAARDDGAMASYSAADEIGWVKHGLQLAFYHLRRGSAYEEGLRHALLAGGDTDTNAAIVGGMLGALHGAAAIPAAMRSKVEAFERLHPGRGSQAAASSAPVGYCRPERLRGRQLAPLARRLFEDAARDAGKATVAAAAAEADGPA